MGPHHEKKIIKRLIYPTLTFLNLTTRLVKMQPKLVRVMLSTYVVYMSTHGHDNSNPIFGDFC